jgi:hypothetical protein
MVFKVCWRFFSRHLEAATRLRSRNLRRLVSFDSSSSFSAGELCFRELEDRLDVEEVGVDGDFAEALGLRGAGVDFLVLLVFLDLDA